MTTRGELLDTPLDELLRAASRVRDGAFGDRVTYSPKVVIPLTMLCRDRCGYCTFAKAPARLSAPYLSSEEVLSIARAGAGARRMPRGAVHRRRGAGTSLSGGGGVAVGTRLRVHHRLPRRHVRVG